MNIMKITIPKGYVRIYHGFVCHDDLVYNFHRSEFENGSLGLEVTEHILAIRSIVNAELRSGRNVKYNPTSGFDEFRREGGKFGQ